MAKVNEPRKKISILHALDSLLWLLGLIVATSYYFQHKGAPEAVAGFIILIAVLVFSVFFKIVKFLIRFAILLFLLGMGYLLLTHS
jgi:hypothetical protein